MRRARLCGGKIKLVLLFGGMFIRLRCCSNFFTAANLPKYGFIAANDVLVTYVGSLVYGTNMTTGDVLWGTGVLPEFFSYFPVLPAPAGSGVFLIQYWCYNTAGPCPTAGKIVMVVDVQSSSAVFSPAFASPLLRWTNSVCRRIESGCSLLCHLGEYGSVYLVHSDLCGRAAVADRRFEARQER